MDKNFAKHLSEVLEGMSYSEAVEVLEGVVNSEATIVLMTEDMGEFENYPIRFETSIDVVDGWELRVNEEYVNLLEEYGIKSILYRFEINPTEDEMIEFLDFNTMEYDDENLLDETLVVIEEQLDRYDFDNVLSFFSDVRVEWDVVVDEEYHFYRAGNDELMSY